MMPQIFNTEDKKLDFSKYIFNLECNSIINKPQRALWTSPIKTINDVLISPWLYWCLLEDFRIYKHTYILYLKENLRILTINNENDLKLLPRIVFEFGTCLDFKALSEYYDGIYLTENGASELHSIRENISFNSWDVESVCWFNVEWIKDTYYIKDYYKYLEKKRHLL